MAVSDSYISAKCRNLSFAAILAVVLIHSHALVTSANSSEWAVRLLDVICLKSTCWAVPFFFLTSGYWFGNGNYAQGGGLGPFVKKKLRTLVVPYLVFVLLGLVCVHFMQWVYINVIGSRPNSHVTWSWDIFSFSQILPVGNGPLWFLRSLIVLFILSPAWRFCLNRCPVVLLLLGLLSLISPPLVIGGCIPFRIGQASFFFLGVYLSRVNMACTRRMVQDFPKTCWGVCVVVVMIILVCFSGAPIGIPRTGVLPVSLLLLVWIGYDMLFNRVMSAMTLAPFVFWIFCTHIILLNCILPVARLLKCANSALLFLLTFVAYGIALIADIGLGMLFKSKLPALYNVATGNR